MESIFQGGQKSYGINKKMEVGGGNYSTTGTEWLEVSHLLELLLPIRDLFSLVLSTDSIINKKNSTNGFHF